MRTSFIIKGLCGLGLLCAVSVSMAQGVVNSAQLVYSNGIQTVIAGGANPNFENQGSGQIITDGTGGVFNIEGNISNLGSNDLNFNLVKAKFIGSISSTIGGTKGLNYRKFEIAKTASSYTVNLAVCPSYQIFDELKMTQGQLDLRDYWLDLGTTGVVSNETNANRIKATDGSTEGKGVGTISATRTLIDGSNTNIAGLGIDINSSTFTGEHQITRGHHMLQGSGSFSGNVSVNRWFYVPDFQQVTSSNEIVFHYFEDELNGHSEDELVMYEELQNEYGEFWVPLNTTPDNTIDYCYLYNSGDYGYYALPVDEVHYQYVDRFTLGSLSNPLPISLINFNVDCNGISVNIDWTTASELNNDFFSIERSLDGVNFSKIATIAGAGNSNQPRTYHYFDNFSSKNAVYYRLSQTDYNGQTQSFQAKSAHCGDSEIQEPNIYSPNQHDIVIDFYNKSDEAVKAEVFNDLGQLIYQYKGVFTSGYQKINIQNLIIAPNIVLVKFFNNNQFVSKKLFLTN